MENDSEKSAIKISLIGASFFAVIGIGFAVFTRSQAILLDGAFNLISAVMALFASKIASLVGQPDSVERPLGYIALEPFYVLIKGAILTVLTIVVVISNIIVLFQGGSELQLGLVVLYILFVVIGNAFIYLLIKQKEKRGTSPLISVERENWFVNTIISSAIAVSFISVFLLRNGRLSFVVPYVDQIVVVLVGLFSLPIPLKAIKQGLGELLLFGPEKDLYANVKEVVDNQILNYSVNRHKLYLLQIGRKLFVTVIIDPIDEKIPGDFSDQVKADLVAGLIKVNTHVQLDVVISKTIET